MAVALNDVKLYLRIDGEAEDSLLAQCMDAAESYLVSAVSDYEANYAADAGYAAKADMVKLAIIAEMYGNRDPSNDGRVDFPFCIRSQITQLQYYVPAETEGGGA